MISSRLLLLQGNHGSTSTRNFITWRDDLDGVLGTGSTNTHKLSGGSGGPIEHDVKVSISFKSGKQTPTNAIVLIKGRVL